jgi:hypothetical protein
MAARECPDGMANRDSRARWALQEMPVVMARRDHRARRALTVGLRLDAKDQREIPERVVRPVKRVTLERMDHWAALDPPDPKDVLDCRHEL